MTQSCAWSCQQDSDFFWAEASAALSYVQMYRSEMTQEGASHWLGACTEVLTCQQITLGHVYNCHVHFAQSLAKRDVCTFIDRQT